jgi:hypothetical protein
MQTTQLDCCCHAFLSSALVPAYATTSCWWVGARHRHVDRLTTVGTQQQVTAERRTEAHVAAGMARALAAEGAPVVAVYCHFSPMAVIAGFSHAVSTTSAARIYQRGPMRLLLLSLLCWANLSAKQLLLSKSNQSHDLLLAYGVPPRNLGIICPLG